MKEMIKNLCVLLVIGYIIYKIYKKFIAENDLLDFSELEDHGEYDLEAAAEDSLTDKIKRAAGKAFTRLDEEF